MGGLFGGGGATTPAPQRLSGVRLQSSVFGLPIQIIYGRHRVSGNIIWYGDFQSVPQTSSAGGKGGGSSQATGYRYSASVAIALGEGQIEGIQSIWEGKKKVTGLAIAQPTTTGKGVTSAVFGLVNSGVGSRFSGSVPQTPWSYLTSKYPAQALGYSGLAYLAAVGVDLGTNAQLPNYSFEVQGLLRYSATTADANPKDIITDFLMDTKHGALFPAGRIGDMTQFSNYCVANGIFLSVVVDQHKRAADWIMQWLKACHSTVIYSDGVLKFIPYGDEIVTGNGVTYTPNLTPVYDLDDDSYISDIGGDPVKVRRKAQSDTPNSIKVEYANRNNFYNPEIVEAHDQANIEAFGLRPASPEKLVEICNSQTARQVAQLILQRGLYIRNEYQFTLPWKYALLEPMDVVTLTDAKLGLDREPVRIVSIEEDEFGLLTVVAEELPIGVAAASLYAHEGGSGFATDYNVDPGSPNDAVVFEAPDALTAAGLEIWMAVSGGSNWGGCEVWVSRDNATYTRVGEIHGSARHGFLTASLPSVADPDTTSTLAVDISACGGQLSGGTRADADAYNTLCYVDGEFLSYQSATLTGTGKYNLGTCLRRGAYGSTITAHNAGSRFARIDQAIFKYAFAADMIGTPLYIKLLSFNTFGAAKQALDAVSPITYNITGYALKSPLPNVTGLVNNYRNGQTLLSWKAVSDFRTAIEYEVRQGTAWDTAVVVGSTPLTEMPVSADGTYWVAAKYISAQNVVAYSAAAQSVSIGNAVLPANVVATFDEAATGWAGQVTTPAFFDPAENAIKLGGTVLFSSIPLISGANTVEYYGGIVSGGYYQIPVGHEIDIGVAQACNCSVGVQAKSDSPFAALFSTIPLMSAQADVAGNFAGKSSLQVEIDTAQNDGIWQGWRNFVPGQYVARKFRFRVKLMTSDPTVSTILSGFKFTVDVPDRIDTGTNIAAPAGGIAVTFATPFHAVPNVQVTILNPQANDVIAFPVQPTVSGFTVQITNGGAGVARNINWMAKGY